MKTLIDNKKSIGLKNTTLTAKQIEYQETLGSLTVAMMHIPRQV